MHKHTQNLNQYHHVFIIKYTVQKNIKKCGEKSSCERAFKNARENCVLIAHALL